MLLKKILSKSLAAAICLFSLALGAFAAPEVGAKAAILIDKDSGRVLFEKNADQPLPIASTTKIMTAMIVLENCGLDEVVTVTAAAAGIEGSSLYLKAGEKLTVRDLLYGLMLRSGNDAAMALAIHCAGSVEAFAQMMNEKARRLGLRNCHFMNPSGLDDDNHLCSAHDLAIIAGQALENPDFAKIVATRHYSFGTRTVVNHNRLLSLYDGAVGIKTGFTKASGRTLVGAAERDGQTLIAVTLNAPDDWNDQMHMLSWGFETYPNRAIIRKGEIFDLLDVVSGDKNRVPVCASEDFYYPLAEGERPLFALHLPDFAFAPIKRSDFLGKAEVFLGGEKIGDVLLEAACGVKEAVFDKKSSIFDRIFG